MNIDRRTFMKFMGAFGAGVAASGIEMPGGIVKPPSVATLPPGPLTVDAVPRLSAMRELAAEFLITSIAVDMPFANVTSLGDSRHQYIPTPEVIINLEAMAWCDDATAEQILRYFRAGWKLPLWHQEWLCAYCGSPQPIHKTHCAQCGGAREWIVT